MCIHLFTRMRLVWPLGVEYFPLARRRIKRRNTRSPQGGVIGRWGLGALARGRPSARAVRGTLMVMTRAELHRLDAAPYDDEELTDEDLRAVEEARSEPGISWSDAEAELNAG
jgi:hypothetical protein